MPTQRPTCEAATASGEPCRGIVHHTVDLGDQGVRQLCGFHVRLARRGRFTPWAPGQPPPPKRRYTKGGTWTAAEDADVVASDVSDAALAARLGRTVEAIRQRRYVLRRRPWVVRS